MALGEKAGRLHSLQRMCWLFDVVSLCLNNVSFQNFGWYMYLTHFCMRFWGHVWSSVETVQHKFTFSEVDVHKKTQTASNTTVGMTGCVMCEMATSCPISLCLSYKCLCTFTITQNTKQNGRRNGKGRIWSVPRDLMSNRSLLYNNNCIYKQEEKIVVLTKCDWACTAGVRNVISRFMPV